MFIWVPTTKCSTPSFHSVSRPPQCSSSSLFLPLFSLILQCSLLSYHWPSSTMPWSPLHSPSSTPSCQLVSRRERSSTTLVCPLCSSMSGPDSMYPTFSGASGY
uniref:Uncharacterized protein n=1 Tax=Cacopsylla melanoneura TaxID=428564 RepID=A0A8D8U0U7_9HEMI